MADDPLSAAIALLKVGRDEEARQILLSIVQEEPERESAWMWLAETFPREDQRIQVLEQYLRINPHSGVALAGLAKLQNRIVEKKETPVEAVSPEPESESESEKLPSELPTESFRAVTRRDPWSELASEASFDDMQEDEEPVEEQSSMQAAVAAFRYSPEDEFDSGMPEEEVEKPKTAVRRRQRRSPSRVWLGIIVLIAIIVCVSAGTWYWFTFGPGRTPEVASLPSPTVEPVEVVGPESTPTPVLVPTFTDAPVSTPTETPPPPTPTPDPFLPVPVYFLRGEPSNRQIWRMEINGTLTRITEENEPIRGFDVSQRDGTIAYLIGNRVVLADQDGNFLRTILFGDPDPGNDDNWARTKRITDLLWSPDGGRLAYGQNGVNVFILSTGQIIPLIRNEVPASGQIRLYLPKLWTKDGTRLITRIALSEASSVAVVPANGAPVIRADPAGGVRLPCCDIGVSMDGRTALIAGAQIGFQEVGLFRMDLVTGKVDTLFISEPGSLFTHFAAPSQDINLNWHYFFSVSTNGEPGFMSLHQAGPDGITDFVSIRDDGLPLGDMLWSPNGEIVLRYTEGGFVLIRTDDSPGVGFAIDGIVTNLRWGVWPGN